MRVVDSIQIDTTAGVKTIQLSIGDLSRIPLEWHTDYLLISTFPNNYNATPSSVVGALNNRGISVKRVAKDKAEDLRSKFFCWYSKPMIEVLPETKKIPFKRLLCFENPAANTNVADDVATLFRGLTTVRLQTINITFAILYLKRIEVLSATWELACASYLLC